MHFHAQIELVSRETGETITKQHGFHLGTDATVARSFCEEFHQQYGGISREFRPQSVALMRGNVIVDIFDGEWFSGWPR
jgi:hypothetical protein